MDLKQQSAKEYGLKGSFEFFFSKSGSGSGSAVSWSSAIAAKKGPSNGGLALTPIDNTWLQVLLEEPEADDHHSSGEDSPPKTLTPFYRQ